MTTPVADLVLHGPVWTGDAARSWADAVAARDGVLVALGADAAREATGPRTRVVDARDAMVLPGFQDAHCHPVSAGRQMLQVWLHDVAGREAYLGAIADYARRNSDQPWVLGGGWAMEAFPGGTPHRRDLDAVVADRPAFLFNRDVHGAWVNTRALEVAGITRDTPDPSDGRIERDAEGEPTGMLHEGAAYSFQDRHLPAPGAQDWRAGALQGQQHLHSLGITGWQDAWVDAEIQAAYESLAASGRLTARVRGALWWDRHRGLEQVAELVERRAAGVAAGRGRFLPTTVKIMLDGVLENFTAALLEPYGDGRGGQTENRGLSYLEPDLLHQAVTALDGAGFQVHMHAIGDRAVRDALDAVQAAAEANGSAGARRHHIAHLQVVQPSDVPRFRELGVTATCQAYWAQLEPQMTELTIPFLGPERSRLQYPFADLWRAGATLAMGSDWAVTTADPLQQIAVAVNRVDPADREGEPFLPEQALPLPVALAAFTAGSAYVDGDDGSSGSGDDDRKGGSGGDGGGSGGGGWIAPGRRADLAVLDRNLFAHPAEEIGDARVVATVASGAMVYEAE